MLPTLLALAVIVSGDGSVGGSPSRHSARSSGHASRGGTKSTASGTGASSTSATSSAPTSSSAGGGSTGGGAGTKRIVATGGGSGSPGSPVAYFVATSPVAPGAPVTYTDESYDTTPGATIVDATWQGRSTSFASPGVYTVSLTVTDTYGRQSTYTSQVLVSATTAQAPAGKPSAFFLVTSPVAAGAPVAYTDESYDLDPSAYIVNEVWSGRQASFALPGTYPVSLRVEDSTGAWSSLFTRDVAVTAPSSVSGTGSGSTAPPSSAASATPAPWTALAAPDPATPGSLVTVTAIAPTGATGAPTLTVPPPLQGTWDGVSYAKTNASGAMIADGGGRFTLPLVVPDSPAFPPGTYDLVVNPPDGAQPVTVALVVQAATSYVEPIVSGA